MLLWAAKRRRNVCIDTNASIFGLRKMSLWCLGRVSFAFLDSLIAGAEARYDLADSGCRSFAFLAIDFNAWIQYLTVEALYPCLLIHSPKLMISERVWGSIFWARRESALGAMAPGVGFSPPWVSPKLPTVGFEPTRPFDHRISNPTPYQVARPSFSGLLATPANSA